MIVVAINGVVTTLVAKGAAGTSLFADGLFSTADPFLNFAGFLFRVP